MFAGTCLIDDLTEDSEEYFCQSGKDVYIIVGITAVVASLSTRRSVRSTTRFPYLDNLLGEATR